MLSSLSNLQSALQVTLGLKQFVSITGFCRQLGSNINSSMAPQHMTELTIRKIGTQPTGSLLGGVGYLLVKKLEFHYHLVQLTAFVLIFKSLEGWKMTWSLQAFIMQMSRLFITSMIFPETVSPEVVALFILHFIFIFLYFLTFTHFIRFLFCFLPLPF